jgi:hypothetical protein
MVGIMKKALVLLVAVGKLVAVNLAVLSFSMATFGLFCIFVFHAKFSVKGCGLLLAISCLLWICCCWRSKEPALRTFGTLLLTSTLIFLFLLGISLLRFMLEHSALIRMWHIGLFLTAVLLFWYLRGVSIRRNKQTESFNYKGDAV